MAEGIANLEAVIERLERATGDARQATSEAHAAVKAVRAVMREGVELIARIEQTAAVEVDRRMRAAVDEGLDEFKGACRGAIELQAERITEIFERRANLCMYGNEQGKGVNVFDAMHDYLVTVREAMQNDPRLPSLYGPVPPPPPTNSRREKRAR